MATQRNLRSEGTRESRKIQADEFRRNLTRYLHQAKFQAVTEVLKNSKLIEPKSNLMRWALIRACRHQLVEMAKLLLDAKVDPDQGYEPQSFDGIVPEEWPRTPPLHTACRFAGKKREVSELVAVLLEHNADVNKEDFYDRATPLGWAARNGYRESADLMLKAGANVDSGFPGGKTPLIEAAQGGHVLTVKILLDHSADVEAKDERGMTALAWAYHCPSPYKEEIIALLTEAGK
jgi:ankyrin repeat protein